MGSSSHHRLPQDLVSRSLFTNAHGERRTYPSSIITPTTWLVTAGPHATAVVPLVASAARVALAKVAEIERYKVMVNCGGDVHGQADLGNLLISSCGPVSLFHLF